MTGVYVSDGKIYAAPISGLSISTNGGSNFTNYTTANGLGDDTALSVYESGGTVYVATYGGLGISTNGGSSYTNHTADDGLGNNRVLGVYESGGLVYAATEGGLSIAAVPGPSTIALVASASAGLACMMRWRKRRVVKAAA